VVPKATLQLKNQQFLTDKAKIMKNKSILIAAVAVFSLAFAKAQEADDCNIMLQIFAENAKAGSYDEAYKQLGSLVQQCPNKSAAIYQYGERIYEHRLRKKIGNEDANVKGLLMMLRKEISDYADFIDVTRKEIEIARTMYDYNQGTEEEQYNMFDHAYKADKENFTDPKAMITYFKLVEKRYEAGIINLQEFFDIYDDLVLQIEKVQDERGKILTGIMDKEAAGTFTDEDKKQMDAQEINIKNYGIVMGSVNATLGALADCDKLIPLYEAEFENKKSDKNWLSNVLRRLQSKECTDAPLYITSVKALHDINPSGNTAYGLGNIAANQSEKFKYWDQAIELGISKELISRIHYKKGMAYKSQGQYSSSKREFIAANAAKPSFGNPFYQIATMIASSANSCGDTTFEKRAVYWIAARWAQKAGAVDPSLRSTAQQAVANYNGTAPQKADIFTNPHYNSGQIITIGCWIGESVKIP
jgi:tetratricopeptide (TPR) repeat protein